MERIKGMALALALALSSVEGAQAGETARYVLMIEENGPSGRQVTRTTFDLEGTDQRVAVIRGYAIGDGEAWTEVVVTEDCRRAFGAQGDEIGRVRVVPEQERIDDLAPVCAPEPLFGAMTDLASFALIAYSPEFRVGELAEVGQALPLLPFEVEWSRPPALIGARLSSPGGEVRLLEVSAGLRRISWSPGPMPLVIRRAGPGGAEMTLEGVETIALEVDLIDGELAEGRSTVDRLDMTLKMPGLPPAGMPVAIVRSLTLKRENR